jgi:hypothetical protein
MPRDSATSLFPDPIGKRKFRVEVLDTIILPITGGPFGRASNSRSHPLAGHLGTCGDRLERARDDRWTTRYRAQ